MVWIRSKKNKYFAGENIIMFCKIILFMAAVLRKILHEIFSRK